MAQEKPVYETVNEFSKMARKVIDKYPEIFYGREIDQIKCVKITNKERPESKDCMWVLQAVKEPVRLDCPYAWYAVLWSKDWDEMDEKHRYLLIADILHGIPNGEDEGKVNPPDSKGYKCMQRTFKGIDFMTDPNVPHIIDDSVVWITNN